MADAGDRQRICDFLETELVVEPTEADKLARDVAELALAGHWREAFLELAPCYLSLLAKLCLGETTEQCVGVMHVLRTSTYDASMYENGDPLPASPMSAREPAAGDQRRLGEFLILEWRVGTWAAKWPAADRPDGEHAAALAALADAPGGWRTAFTTLARVHTNLVVAVCRGDLELARATLRRQPYGRHYGRA